MGRVACGYTLDFRGTALEAGLPAIRWLQGAVYHDSVKKLGLPR